MIPSVSITVVETNFLYEELISYSTFDAVLNKLILVYRGDHTLKEIE